MDLSTDCAGTRRRLWEYLDGALPPEEAYVVERHLAGCEGCAPACACRRALLAAVARARGAQPQAPRVLRLRIVRVLASAW